MVKNCSDKVVFDMPKNIVPSVVTGTDLYTSFCLVKALVDDLASKVDLIDDYPETKTKVEQLVIDVGNLGDTVERHKDWLNSITDRIDIYDNETIPAINDRIDDIEAEEQQIRITLNQIASRIENIGVELQNKLDKVYSEGSERIYGINEDGTQEIKTVSNGDVANSIVKVMSNGRINVNDPVDNSNPVSLSYFEEHQGGNSNIGIINFDGDTATCDHTPTEVEELFNTKDSVICLYTDSHGEHFANVDYIGDEGKIKITYVNSNYGLSIEGRTFDSAISIFWGDLYNNTWIGLGTEPMASKAYVDENFGKIYLVSYSGSDDNLTCDKTLAEIKSAISAGKLVIARRENIYYGTASVLEANAGVSFATIDCSGRTAGSSMSFSGIKHGSTKAFIFDKHIDYAQYAGTIMARDSDGRARVSSPVHDLDITNKKYVDNLVASKAYTLTLNPDEISATLTGGTYEQLRADIMGGKNVLVTMVANEGSVLTTCICAALVGGSTYLKFYCEAPWNIKYTVSFDSMIWVVTKG